MADYKRGTDTKFVRIEAIGNTAQAIVREYADHMASNSVPRFVFDAAEAMMADELEHAGAKESDLQIRRMTASAIQLAQAAAE